MDNHGIGNALKSFHTLLQISARNTGRTMRMLSQMNEGDFAVVTTQAEARRIQRIAKAELGKEISVIVAPLKSHHQDYHETILMRARGTRKRTFFDHNWVEKYYQKELEDIGARHADFNLYLNGPADEPAPESDASIEFGEDYPHDKHAIRLPKET